MKRRTLDLFFSVGGVALAALLLILSLVLKNNADFAKSYVKDQMVAQRINFTPVAGLDDTEKKADCLVKNAGKPLASGRQAECYSNKYIAYHLSEVNGGKTYSETSGAARAARGAATDAAAKKDPKAEELNATATALEGKVQTLFRGETLRGLLLTSYGFSVFGERANQAFIVSLLAALVLLLASIAGFIHYRRTAPEATV